MAIEKGADEITSAIQRALVRKEGLLIGRNGTIELETLLFLLYQSKPGENYPESIRKRMELHAGIFPANKISLDRWVFMMIESIRSTDVIVAGWYKPLEVQENILLDNINKIAPRIPLRSLEPYYVEPAKRWTHLLKGHTVAVVNAFSETAMKQVNKKEEIWPLHTESLLPDDVKWISIPTGYAPELAQGVAEWPSDVQSWDVAVNYVVKKVRESGARIALIGCGGLGMIIGSELKKYGIISVVLGGALQVLFGIKGNRWASHSVIQHFWNDAWVYPDAKETPAGASRIENACYWK